MLEMIFGLVKKSRLDTALAERDMAYAEVDQYVEQSYKHECEANKLRRLNRELDRQLSRCSDQILAKSQEYLRVCASLAEESDKVRSLQKTIDVLKQNKPVQLNLGKFDDPMITVRSYLERNTSVSSPSSGLLRSIGSKAGRLSRSAGIEPGRKTGVKNTRKSSDYGHWTYPESIVSRAAREVLGKNKKPA